MSPAVTEALRLIAEDRPLPEVLAGIVRSIEMEMPGTLASILLLDESCEHLLVGAAPSLPGDYNAAIDGVAIGPNVGSCGTAAFLNRTIIVEDIQADPLWANFRTLAENAGLRSCWSEPIRDTQGRVLGTFALYHRDVRRPSEAHIQSLAHAAHLVALTLSRKHLVDLLERATRELRDACEAHAAREAFYSVIIGMMPTFLVVKNAADLSFVLINPAAEAALGLVSNTSVGKTVHDLFPAEEALSSDREDLEVIGARSVITDENFAVTTGCGQSKFFTTKKVAVFQDDKPTYIVTVGEDVTERQAGQVALNEALTLAENANAAKSQFLANMSHELRTPLNGIIAMADMLLGLQTDDRTRAMAETIIASGHMLEYVVNDILDVAKIEAGQMKLESAPFNLEAVLTGVTDLHAAAAAIKDVKLELILTPGASGCYIGDQTRVGQVISNLISNAVKFTENGRVIVSASRGRSGLRICVRDTGSGFDRSTAKRLFQRFEQADTSVSRRHGGTGLGLSICRSFCELMGGRIGVRSSAGKGTLFLVTLPLLRAVDVADEASIPTPASEADTAIDRNLRILFADDHDVNRRVVSMILEPLGVDLVMVENGQLALEQAAMTDFDLILMDVQMPVMDGLTATRKIRELESKSGRVRTPVISLTANAMPDDVRRSLEAGSDLHLAKPVRPAALIEAIAALIAPALDDADATATA